MRILIRASKTPFTAFHNGPIPRESLRSVYGALDQEGTKNIGNLVFAHSAYKALSHPDTQIEIDDYQLSLTDSYASKADIINERYDRFVLPMCNSFRIGYEDTLDRMARTLKHIKIPCVVTGVGAQVSIGGSFDELLPIRDQVRAFVKAVLNNSASVGVRGETTRDYLLSLGFPADAVEVIGCPSIFYNGAAMNVQKKELGKVALNLTNIEDPRLDSFAKYFNDHPEGVTYVPQVRRLMVPVAADNYSMADYLGAMDRKIPNLHRSDRIAFITDVVPWINFMREQSFAIGTRIHGNIVPLLAGTPSHVIAHDSRTLELSQYNDVPHTPVTELGDNFDLRAVYDRSDYTALNRNHPERLARYAKFLESNGLQHILYQPELLAAYDQKARQAAALARAPIDPPEPTGVSKLLAQGRKRGGQIYRGVKRRAAKVLSA